MSSGRQYGRAVPAGGVEDIAKHHFGTFAHEHARFHCALASGAAANQRYLPL
jgi:hypothetical protein